MIITRRMREAKTGKALLVEIALANRIALYRDINMKHRRGRASTPCVGIFWLDVSAKKVYAVKTVLHKADDLAGVKVAPSGHYENWPLIEKRNPKWHGVEYEDVPRGRVVYENKQHRPRFVVYTNPIANTPAMKKAIADAFLLPDGHVCHDFSDEHYQIADVASVEQPPPRHLTASGDGD